MKSFVDLANAWHAEKNGKWVSNQILISTRIGKCAGGQGVSQTRQSITNVMAIYL